MDTHNKINFTCNSIIENYYENNISEEEKCWEVAGRGGVIMCICQTSCYMADERQKNCSNIK
jgi:hypothetical protein